MLDLTKIKRDCCKLSPTRRVCHKWLSYCSKICKIIESTSTRGENFCDDSSNVVEIELLFLAILYFLHLLLLLFNSEKQFIDYISTNK